ncbi:GNAT family N-acetyltransferase [Larsenimonas rhizosphaerae]|uniref:GNAT family N-acetyltransferase n=1 Tax=Larsenimonas rhizosphaerae TaxID=2944682 RepID=A0AA41ZC81_9GAMM|nr:GNAT family N-acetyltransferase [Larsenimonas rhizosphaerae]MCX2522647.1 GNAT family N-acetyltransferase [Larsenimonas rhizosphaerae]
MEIEIVDAGEQDLQAIVAIYNQAVRETTAIWNFTEVDEANRWHWLRERVDAGYPVLVARSGGHCLGYATYGPWRPHDGFARTVEHSVYVAEGRQGNGIGSTLMKALMVRAADQGIHVMVAGIDAGNPGSIRLHERLGFSESGRLPQVGMKFGRWLDLVFMQYVFPAP